MFAYRQSYCLAFDSVWRLHNQSDANPTVGRGDQRFLDARNAVDRVSSQPSTSMWPSSRLRGWLAQFGGTLIGIVGEQGSSSESFFIDRVQEISTRLTSEALVVECTYSLIDSVLSDQRL